LKSPASMVQAVRFTMMQGMHEAMVIDVLRAVEVKVALISTVLTMKSCSIGVVNVDRASR
jgi:hypothetical protein